MKAGLFNFRKNFFFPLLALLILGCGLFNGAASEREQQNEEVSGGAVLGQVVTAEGIGAKNAPMSETDSFSASQDVIYVVAEAEHIPQGTTMFARWSKEGQPFEDSAELIADRDYSNTYVEFHLENLQDQMDSGDYSVQIYVNGNPVKEAQFQVQ
jgi:hypothetical protein